MQWIATAELVSAVANAGALGFPSALTQATPGDVFCHRQARPAFRTATLWLSVGLLKSIADSWRPQNATG